MIPHRCPGTNCGVCNGTVRPDFGKSREQEERDAKSLSRRNFLVVLGSFDMTTVVYTDWGNCSDCGGPITQKDEDWAECKACGDSTYPLSDRAAGVGTIDDYGPPAKTTGEQQR